jgi:nucleoporin NUP2
MINDTIDATEKKDEPEAPKFSFGTPAKAPGLFSFAPSGPLHPTTPDSKTFSATSSTPVAEPPAKLGKFGPGGSAPQLAFGGAKSSGGSSPTKAFSFGAPSSAAGFSFGAATPEAPAPAAASGFSFGAKPAADPKPAGFSFGASSAAEAPKAGAGGFSFGSSGSAPAAAAKPFSFGSTSTPSFSFGASSASGSTPAPATPAAAPAPAEDDSGSKNLADAVGQGEEHEDTVVEQRGRLLELVEGKWQVVGLGQFKFKRAKEGGKRRLLMRADGSGKVLMVSAIRRRKEYERNRIRGTDAVRLLPEGASCRRMECQQ